MNEGYLILDCKHNSSLELLEVEMLAKAIKKLDPSRPITLITDTKDYINPVPDISTHIVVNDPNPTSRYFKSLIASPYEKTIALWSNQLLTSFDASVWENLRGMEAIVLPKNRYAFNDTILNSNVYMKGDIELKSFNQASILNAIYFNKQKNCDDLFGLAVILAASYNRDEFIEVFKEVENHSMPSFPEYIWDSWLVSLLQKITEFRISTYDFMHCIDLSMQENNFQNNKWNKKWNEFLSYWINEQGEFKIENFVQKGLINYSNNSWITSTEIKNLRANF